MIYTFGHSTLTPGAATEILHAADIDVLMDIRSHPTSKWEQWRREELEEWVLDEAYITYEWEPGLGGWRAEHLRSPTIRNLCAEHGVDLAAYARGAFPKQRIAADRPGAAPGPAWTNQGLWDYSWFMALPEFLRAADDLIDLGGGVNVAIMCAELLWWRCHRSMVADYLTWRGVEVVHLQPTRRAHVDAIGNRLDRYHPDIIKAWKEHNAA